MLHSAKCSVDWIRYFVKANPYYIGHKAPEIYHVDFTVFYKDMSIQYRSIELEATDAGFFVLQRIDTVNVIKLRMLQFDVLVRGVFSLHPHSICHIATTVCNGNAKKKPDKIYEYLHFK